MTDSQKIIKLINKENKNRKKSKGYAIDFLYKKGDKVKKINIIF